VKNGRPWARGLFDEELSWQLNSEEFPSEPVFDYRTHQAEPAARPVCATLPVQSGG